DRRATELGVVSPIVEATYENGVVKEIDHGSGPKGRDQLAHADPALGGAVQVLFAFLGGHYLFPFGPPSKGPRYLFTQRCEVSSTSRIEVGAQKRPSGELRGGAFSSSTWCSKGVPPDFSLSNLE